MFISLRKRLSNREDGFTLIELMVVVLIIAILIAIAVPTFLGARKRAQDRAAQSSVNVTLKDARAVFTDNESYFLADGLTPAISQTVLDAAEPSLDFGPTDGVGAATAAAGDPNFVSWHVVDANSIILASWSKSGMCFLLQDVQGPQTASGLGTTYSKVTVGADATACTSNPLPAGTPAFGKNGWK